MLCVIALVTVAASFTQAAERQPYTNIGADSLNEFISKNTKIVDIRRPDEWRDTGVIANSKLLMAFDAQGRFNPDFPRQFEAYVGKDEDVVIICRSGNRSSRLSQLLTERAGYSRVYNVSGGIVGWIDAGNPTVPCPVC
jgi:rhodanese-related sulfurtransferase